MFKEVFKRVCFLLLPVVIFFSLFLPISGVKFNQVFAATPLEIGVDGLRADYQNGSWVVNGGTILGSATGTAGDDCDAATNEVATLSFKNERTVSAHLSFSYSNIRIDNQNGSVKINGNSVTGSGSFSTELSAGQSISIELNSGDIGENTTSIEISGISLVVNTTVTMSFSPNTGGSFTVDGNQITSESVFTRQSTDPFSLVATPDSNHKFFGWKSNNNNRYYSFDSNWEARFEEDDSISPGGIHD